MKRGLFITFEGPDGAGKTTQIKLLKAFLENQNYQCITTREPGGTPIAENLRKILRKNQKDDPLTKETELLLMTAARAQHVKNKILPAINKNKIVLCDRFLDSTTAYQGYGRGLDMELIDKLHNFVVGTCMPDLTILLDITYGQALERMNSRANLIAPDRLDMETQEFHEKVREGFLEIAKNNSERIKIFSASQPVEHLHDQIKECVLNVIKKIQR